MSNTLSVAEISDVQVGAEAAGRHGPIPEPRLTKGSRTRRKASPCKKQCDATATNTKQDVVLQMLRRQSGVTVDDIVSKTAWQQHSVRGFLSGVVRKKLKLPLVSELGKDGVRRYHVTSLRPAKEK
jgi:Protein of unknown function (DUF3489)